jgi:hypothetical protein
LYAVKGHNRKVTDIQTEMDSVGLKWGEKKKKRGKGKGILVTGLGGP